MKRQLAVVLVSVVLLFALPSLSGSLGAGAASPAGGLGPYYKTFTGNDFDSFDSDDVVRFAALTGGGVWVKSRAPGGSGPSYLEVGVELPSGAQGSAVTFYVRN